MFLKLIREKHLLLKKATKENDRLDESTRIENGDAEAESSEAQDTQPRGDSQKVCIRIYRGR